MSHFFQENHSGIVDWKITLTYSIQDKKKVNAITDSIVAQLVSIK